MPITMTPKKHHDLNYVREKWGWFALFGATMLITGLVALICTTTTTLVTVLFLGWVLLISGGVQLLETFAVRSWGGVFMHLMTGILQLVVGFLLISAPAANAVLITFMFAIFLMVNGLFRVFGGFGLPVVGGLVAFSGLASFILGLMVWRQWPDSSLWFIGFFVGVDLIMHGAAWLAFAMRARKLTPASDAGMTPAVA